MNTLNKIITCKYQSLNNVPRFNKKLSLSVALFFLGIASTGVFPPVAAGDTVSNGSYSIDVGNIDTNPQPTPRPQVLGTQAKSEFTTGPNYTVSTSNDSFAIKLSQDAIDYGALSSTNPVIRTSEIAISNPKNGAEVLTSEDHPLQFKKNVIQNTTCDNGACTPSTASLWTNTLTYGFGYRCDDLKANVCDPQFSTTNYYKQYPNLASGQNYEPIMLSDTHNSLTKATITNKVNISGTQKQGGYDNSITYVAIPNF